MGKRQYRKSKRDVGSTGQNATAGHYDGKRQKRDYYELPLKENEKLQRYYNGLLKLPESEREELWAAARRELPNSFRFCGSKGRALAVRELFLNRYIPEMEKMESVDGHKVDPPTPVPWYPDELAWWMTTPKHVVRRHAPFSAFQRFLVSETSVGNISRQEVVSMIPPLLLDVRPGMAVLDMCASPGSKSCQILEMLHQGEEDRVRWHLDQAAAEGGNPDSLAEAGVLDDTDSANIGMDRDDAGRATGLLIANDADQKRCHMLVHNLKRLSSPNLLVTSHDASIFPLIRLPSQPTSRKPETTTAPPVRYLRFDRILADVPCSGDGTLRKNATLWRDWTPGNPLGMHTLQLRILIRALQLLKVGGTVVYSTCSMNPVENEAVVGSAIASCGGASCVDLVDCSDRLPGLRRVPGLMSWNVMGKTGRVWSSWAEVEDHATSSGLDALGRLTYSMFPRLEGEEGAGLPLDRCMRVYPHLQDTGAFFIAVLKKKFVIKTKPSFLLRRPLEGFGGLDGAPVLGGTSVPDGLSLLDDVSVLDDAPMLDDTSMVDNAIMLDGASMHQDWAPTTEAFEATEEKLLAAGDDTSTAQAQRKRAIDLGSADVASDEKRAKTSNLIAGDDVEDVATFAPVAVTGAEPLQDVKKAKQRQGFVDEPYRYIRPDHPLLESIMAFFQVSEKFPRDRFMVRNERGEPHKMIYYTSALARDVLEENQGRGMRFVYGGVRMLLRQEIPREMECCWRVQSEGLVQLQGYVGPARRLRLTQPAPFQYLLREMFPRVDGDTWRALGDEIGPRLRDISLGCCILNVRLDLPGAPLHDMALALWRSLHSVNLMLPKEDRAAMLLRLYNDLTPLVNTGLDKGDQQQNQDNKPVEWTSTMEEAVEDADSPE